MSDLKKPYEIGADLKSELQAELEHELQRRNSQRLYCEMVTGHNFGVLHEQHCLNCGADFEASRD